MEPIYFMVTPASLDGLEEADAVAQATALGEAEDLVQGYDLGQIVARWNRGWHRLPQLIELR